MDLIEYFNETHEINNVFVMYILQNIDTSQ